MRQLLAIILLLPVLTVSAEVWTAGDCPSEHAQERAEFKKRLLSAKPGDELYLPHPFPKTPKHAVEDFIYFHRRIIDRQEGETLSDDARFFETLDSGNVRFLVSEVGNWTPGRCGRRQQSDFYFLIQAFDQRSGDEITRVALAESGRVFQLMHRQEDEGQGEFAISELPKLRLPASLGPASGAQYVATVGPTLLCQALQPCIAFKSGGRAYLSVRDRIYQLDTDRPLSFRERFAKPEARAAFLQNLQGRSETVISLGGDRMAFAVPLDQD
jgi:hypothetical protein